MADLTKKAKIEFEADLSDVKKEVSQLKNEVDQIGNKASKIKSSGGSSGSSSSSGGGSSSSSGAGKFDIAGMFKTAGFTAVGVAAGALASKLSEAANRANEFSKNVSNIKLDKLSAEQRKNKQKEDLLALGPGADLALAGERAKAFGNDILQNLPGLRGDPKELQKQLDSVKLKGGDKIQLDRMLRDQAEGMADLANEQMVMERGLYEQRRNLEHDLANRKRDLALEGAKLEEDFSRRKRDLGVEEQKAATDNSRKNEDLALKRQRTQEDFALKQQKFNENFAGWMDDQRFKLDREKSARDFSTKMSDKAADFSRDRRYAAEDYQDNQFEMLLNGASAKDFFLAARRRNKEERRANEQYQVGVERDNRDFKVNEEEAAKQRSLDLAQREYDRRYELAEMTLDYTRSLHDLNVETKRQAEDQAMQAQELANKNADLGKDEQFAREEFKNKQEDLAWDEKTSREDLAFSEQQQRADFAKNSSRQKRNYDEQLSDFAGGLDDKYGPLLAPYLIKNSGLQNYAKQYEQQAGMQSGTLTNLTSAQALQTNSDLANAQRKADLEKTQDAFKWLGPLGILPGSIIGTAGVGIKQLTGGYDPAQLAKNAPAAVQSGLAGMQNYNGGPQVQQLQTLGGAAMPQMPIARPAPVNIQIGAPAINAPLSSGAMSQIQGQVQDLGKSIRNIAADDQAKMLLGVLNGTNSY